jgi:NTE family protein
MRALVLSGGGVKGAYQVGVLKRWMGEQGIDYDIMCGVSVGSLNVAGLAMTPKGHPDVAIKAMETFWKTKVNTAAIYKRWFPFGRLHALWLKSLYDSTPLQDLVHQTMDAGLILAGGRQVAVGCVCLDTGEYHYARENDPEFVQWVLASSSFPVFLKPIEIGGKWYSDGGIKHVTPLGQAINMGADEIDVIMCSNLSDDPFNASSTQAIPGILLRAVDLMNDQIIQDDLALCGLKNDLATIDSKYRKVKVRIVKPAGDLTSNSLDFNPTDVLRMIDQGYKDADSAVEYL